MHKNDKHLRNQSKTHLKSHTELNPNSANGNIHPRQNQRWHLRRHTSSWCLVSYDTCSSLRKSTTKLQKESKWRKTTCRVEIARNRWLKRNRFQFASSLANTTTSKNLIIDLNIATTEDHVLQEGFFFTSTVLSRCTF